MKIYAHTKSGNAYRITGFELVNQGKDIRMYEYQTKDYILIDADQLERFSIEK